MKNTFFYMRKGDFIWIITLSAFAAILVVPSTREAFMAFTSSRPYMGGFVKFALLATMGDLLGARIVKGRYIIPPGIIFRIVIWGIIGMMVSLVFTIFMEGAKAAQNSGLLPFKGVAAAQAFFGSTVMNLTFGPMMMAFHKFTDLYADAKFGGREKVTLSRLVDRLDWHSLVEFSWVKTCIFFWIPAHTAVFMLPAQYRVLVSAFLSIALGLLLALAKKEKRSAAVSK